jgi:hypothetical protein
MLLQSPDDVARELRRNPGKEYDLRPAQAPHRPGAPFRNRAWPWAICP